MLAAIPPEIPNYWAPLSQIVPVISLALVIEARTTAKQWKVKKRVWTRRLQSTGYFVAAFALLQVEATALGNMIRGTSSSFDANVSGVLLITAMSIVMLNPIQNLADAANLDLWLVVIRWMPWSQWRKNVKSIEALEDKFETFLAGVLASDDAHEEAVRNSKEIVLKQRRAIAEMDDVLATELPADITEEVRAEVTLSFDRARTVLVGARLTLNEMEHAHNGAKRLRGLGRKHIQQCVELCDSFDHARVTNRIGNQSPADQNLLRSTLSKVTANANR